MNVREPYPIRIDEVLPAAPFTAHRFSVEQYHHMIAAGILTTNDRVQLLEGLILEMPRVTPQHAYATNVLMHLSLEMLGEGWEVFVRQPVVLTTSEPEPDLSMVRGTNQDYCERLPMASDVGLLIEVADSTLNLDQTVKTRIYAAAGVHEYWIVNLIDRCIEVHRDPRADEAAFRTCEIIPATGRLTLVLDGHKFGEIPAASILP